MKGTLTEPLIRPVSPEFSEEATPKKDGSSVHAHQAPQFGHHGLPAKDYEVCIVCVKGCESVVWVPVPSQGAGTQTNENVDLGIAELLMSFRAT